MKNLKMKILALLAGIMALMAAAPAMAGDLGFPGEKFQFIKYYSCGATGSGKSSSNPAAMVDGDVVAIPAGTNIDQVYTVIDTAVTGTTDYDVGDDDDADGYIDGSLSLTLGTPGLYGWDAKLAGAYLRIQTAGATDPADIYVVPRSKFYSATGKEVKLDVTGTCTAGAFRIVVEGSYFGR